MKSPEQVDPALTAEDVALIEKSVAVIEQQFAAGKPFVGFLKDPQGPMRPHMWDEVARQAKDAGWDVRNTGFDLKIHRPQPGSRPLGAVRLSKGRPATNIGLVAMLLQGATVEAVLDAFLDDRGLETLLTLRNLGVLFSPKVRLLTSSRVEKRLTRSFAVAVLTELGCGGGEVRVFGADGHEGRIVLLEGGDVVSLGASLNGLDVNERPHRDRDKGDRAAFDARWAEATVFSRQA